MLDVTLLRIHSPEWFYSVTVHVMMVVVYTATGICWFLTKRVANDGPVAKGEGGSLMVNNLELNNKTLKGLRMCVCVCWGGDKTRERHSKQHLV